MNKLVEQKLQEIISKNKTITAAASELKVSRQTIYKWLNRYKRENQIISSVGNKKQPSAHNKIRSEIENVVINIAQKYPDDSVLTLTSKLQQEYKVVLNAATVFRILKRNNIRYAARQKSKPAKVVPVAIPSGMPALEKEIKVSEALSDKKAIFSIPKISVESDVKQAGSVIASPVKIVATPKTYIKGISVDEIYRKTVSFLIIVTVGIMSTYGAYQLGSGKTMVRHFAEVKAASAPSFNPNTISTAIAYNLPSTGFLGDILPSQKNVPALSATNPVPTVSKKVSMSFFDRLSLSLYCGVISFSENINSDRCNYGDVATAATPSLAMGTPVENAATTTPTYIIRYNTEYVSVPSSNNGKASYFSIPGRNGRDGINGKDGANGKDGKNGMDGITTINNIQAPAGFGSYIIPSTTSNSSLGISTIGYLKDTTIDTPNINGGTATNFTLSTPTLHNAIFNGLSIFNDSALFTGSMVVNNFTATTSVLTDATITNSTTTNAYIQNLTIGSSTVGSFSAADVVVSGAFSVNGTSSLATTTIALGLIDNASTTNLTAVNATTTNLVATNATSTNFFTSLLNATTAFFTNLTATNATLTNATSTNLFSSIFNAVTGTVNNLTGGSITATSSLTSNGTLNVTGTSTLATTTASDLTVSGQTTLATASSTGLTATNLYSTSAVLANATTTFFAAVNATTTNATTTRAYITTLVAGSSTLADAVLTRSTTTDAYIIRLVAASSTLTQAIITTLTGTNATFTNATSTNLVATNATSTNFFTSLLNATTAFFTNLTATNATLTNATSTNLFSSIFNAVTGTVNNLTGGSITATSSLTSNGTLNVTGQTTLGNASSTALTATNLYATNATIANSTSTSIYSTLLNAATGAFTNLSSTGTSTFATSGGNVGIGIAAPTAKLHVFGNSILVDNTGVGNTSFAQKPATSGGNAYWDNQSVGTNSIFRVSNGVAVDTTAMTIQSNGYIGIGTSTPAWTLDVESTASNNAGVFRGAGGKAVAIGGSASAGFIQALAHSGSGAGVASLALQPTSGNVGIGTTSPSSLLTVGNNNQFTVTSTGNVSATNNTASASNFTVNNSADSVYAIGVKGSSTGIRIGTGANGGQITGVDNTLAATYQPLNIGGSYLTLTNSSVEVMRVTGNKVGIGTSTPGSLLSVQGNAYIGGNVTATGTLNVTGQTTLTTASSTAFTTNTLYGTNGIFSGNLSVAGQTTLATASSTGLTVTGGTYLATAGGNVGIGTTTAPLATLDVYGSGNDILQARNTAGTSMFRVTNAGDIYFGRTSPGPFISAAGDFRFAVNGNKYNYSIDNGVTYNAQIGSTTYFNMGNVGIGTTNPQTLLNISAATTPQLMITSLSATNKNAQLIFANNATANSGANWRIGTDMSTNNNTDNFQIYKDSLGSAPFTINSIGNVGIGTTNPNVKLEVAGIARVTGTGGFSIGSDSGQYRIDTQGAPGYNFRFLTNADQISGITAAAATFSGNVGIGTSTPGSLLSVQGNAYIGGNIFATGTLGVLGQTTLGNASTTGLTAASLYATNAVLTNATSTNFFTTTLSSTNGYFSGGLGVGIATTSPGVIQTSGNVVIGGSLTVAGSLASSITNGQIQLLATPTGTNIDQGSVYINPPSAGTNNVLLGIAVNGSERARIDAEGDVQIVGSFNSTNVTGTNALSGNLTVGGNTTLGTNASNTVAINGSVSTNIIPSSDLTFDLGSPTHRFSTMYIGTTSISNLVTSGTGATDFTINTGNGTNDTQDSSLQFSRGVATPNAILKWNSTLKQFEFNNFPVNFANSVNVAGTGTSTFAGLLSLTNIPTGVGLGQGSLYINPTSGATNYTLLGIGVNGVERFRVDAEGDTTIQASLGIQNALYNISSDTLTINDKLQVNGNEIKDSTGTTRFAIGATSTVTGGLTTTGALDIGSNAFTSGLINGQTISSAANFTGTLNVTGKTTLSNASSTGLTVTGGTYLATAGGNVGIGTTNPTTKLTVGDGATSAQNTIRIYGDSVANKAPVLSLFRSGAREAFIAQGTTGSAGMWFGNTGGLANYNDATLAAAAQLTIDTTGNVGIGTTAPGALLELSAVSPNLTFTQTGQAAGSKKWSWTGYNSGLVLDTQNDAGAFGQNAITFSRSGTTVTQITMPNGNVGIGTTSPAYKLDVAGSSHIAGTTGAGSLVIDKTGSNAQRFRMFVGDGTSGTIADENYISNLNTGLHFWGGATGTTENVTFLSNGNVGIGTTTPTQKLDVYGGNITTHNAAGDGASGLGSGIIIGAEAASTPFIGLRVDDQSQRFKINLRGNNTSAERFAISSICGGSCGDTEWFNINKNGNIGIGTTTPQAKLDITSSYNNGINLTNGTSVGYLFNDGRMHIESQTNKELYINANTNAPLLVSGGGGNTYFNYGTGNVGIGTTTVPNKLSIATGAGYGGISIGNTGFYANASWQISNYDAVNGKGVGIGYVPDNNGNAIQGFTSGGNGNLSLNPYAGNVGIGTTSPSTKLELYNATTDRLRVATQNVITSLDSYDAGWGMGNVGGIGTQSNSPFILFTNYTNRMTIDTSGNIGIGTTTPGYKLDVNGNTGMRGSLSMLGNTIYLTSGGESLSGVDGAGSANFFARGAMTLDYNANNISTALTFKNKGSAAVTFDSNGNVGIGTVAPTSKLTVYNTGVYDATTTRYTDIVGDFSGTSPATVSNAGAFTGIRMGSVALPGKYAVVGAVSEDVLGYSRSTGLSFWTSAQDATATEKVRISAAGNVGIGTTNPTASLQVQKNGVNYATEAIKITGTPLSNVTDGTSATEGYGLYLSYNVTGNRQFVFADTATGDGVRYIGNSLDGFNKISQARADLTLGTDTNGAHVSTAVSNTQFSVSNVSGTASKIVTEIKGAAAQSGNYLNISSSGGTGDIMSVLSSGNVGIGTTSPSYLLDVNGNARFGGNGALGYFLATQNTFSQYYTGETNPRFQYSRDVNPSGGSSGSLIFNPSISVDGGTTAQTGAGIGQGAARTLTFFTSNGSALTERMRIDGSGNVGIGTTTPGTNLQIQGSSAFDSTTGINLVNGSADFGRTQLRLTGRMQGGNDGWAMNGRNNILFAANANASGVGIGAVGTDKFAIQYQMLDDKLGILSSTGGATPLMVFQQNGNVGIGTTTPSSKLSVQGNAYIGGNITATGTLDILGGATFPNASTTALTATNFYATNATITNATTTNLYTTLLNAVTGNFTNLSSTGTSTFATSGGNVGIGTTNPGAKLDVNGTANASVFTYGSNGGTVSDDGLGHGRIYQGGGIALQYYNGSAVTTGLLLNNSGNVGIGTIAPLSGTKLQLVGASASDAQQGIFQITTGTGVNTDNKLTFGINDGNYAWIQAYQPGTSARNLILNPIAGNVGIGTTSPAYKLDVYGTSAAVAHFISPAATPNRTFLEAPAGQRVELHQVLTAAQDWVTGVDGGDSNKFKIASADDAFASAKLTITTTGNVGIGTTNPQTKLHVGGTTNPQLSIGTIDYGGNSGQAVASIQSMETAGSGGQLLFQTNPWNNPSGTGLYVPQTRMMIDQYGNVGIGTTAPGYPLEIGASTTAAFGSLYNTLSTAGGAFHGFGFQSRYSGAATYIRSAEFNNPVASGGGTATDKAIIYIDNPSGGTNSNSAIVIGGVPSSGNYGIYNASANQNYFAGNVGIGTTTPNNKLEVNGSVGIGDGTAYGAGLTISSSLSAGANHTISFQGAAAGTNDSLTFNLNRGGGAYGFFDIANAGTPQVHFGLAANTAPSYINTPGNFYFNGGGNVGIGTTNPGVKLQVGTSTNPALTTTISGTPGAPATSGMAQTNGNLRLTTNTTNSQVLDIGISNSAPYGAWLQAANGGDLSSNSPLVLNPNGGNVGIGTTNPGAKLDVRTSRTSGTNATAIVLSDAVTGVQTPGFGNEIQFQSNNGQAVGSILFANGGDGTNNQSELRFRTQNTAGALGDRMTITSVGNIGIGTTNPAVKLDVNGMIKTNAGGGNVTTSFLPSDMALAAGGSAGYGSPVSGKLLFGTDGSGWQMRIASRNGTTETDRVTIQDNGNVGIGTTTPQDTLDVNGGARIMGQGGLAYGAGMELSYDPTAGSNITSYNRTGSAFKDLSSNALNYHFLTSSAEKMTILNNGNVGIGATNPNVQLTVGAAGQNTASTSASFFKGMDTVVKILSTANNSGYGPHLHLMEDNPNLYGYDLWYDSGLDTFNIDRYNNSVKTSILTALPGGNVGIGTTNPIAKLDVNGDIAMNYGGVLKLENNGVDNLTYKNILQNYYTTEDVLKIQAAGNSSGQVQLWTSGAQRVTVINNGNVGIGVASPAAKLDIAGNSFVRGSNAHYALFSFSSSSPQWVKLGTLSLAQQGRNANIHLELGQGYNADYTQNSSVDIKVRTSNGVSVDANGFCASATYSRTGRGSPVTGVKLVGNASGCSATAYDVYMNLQAYVGTGYYTVDTAYGGDSWTDSQVAGVSDPGVSSATVLAVTNETVVNNNFAVINGQTTLATASSTGLTVTGGTYLATAGGNVGIGTTNPVYQTEISGLGQTTAALTDAGVVGGSLYLKDSGGLAGNGGALLFGAAVAGGDKPQAAIKALLTDGTANGLASLAFSTRNLTSDTALTERMRILSNGNVGIGTTTPGQKLSVNGNIQIGTSNWIGTAAGASYVPDDGVFGGTINNGGGFKITTGGAESMRILANGNVGIGTTSPLSKLHVYNGTGRNFLITTDATQLGTSGTAIGSFNDAATAYAPLSILGSSVSFNSNVGIGTTTVPYKFVVGGLSTGGSLAVSNAGSLGSEILFNTQGASIINNGGGNELMQFNVPSGGSYYFNNNNATKVLIDGSGNVGIGATAPLSKLDVLVSGTALANADVVGTAGNFEGPTPAGQSSTLSLTGNEAVAANIGGVLGFGGNYNGTQYANWASIKGLKADATSGNYGGYLAFYTRLTGAGSVERMRISDAGNVGIGTTNPGAKLEVLQDANGTTPVVRMIGSAGDPTNYRFDIVPEAHGAAVKWKFNVKDYNNASPYDGAVMTLDAGNVGIGTTNPLAKLHIHGNYNNTGSGGFMLDATDNSDPNTYALRINPFVIGAGKVGYQFVTNSATGGTSTPLVFDNAGNVGIGTTAPGAKLDVNGTANITGVLTAAGGVNSKQFTTASVPAGYNIDLLGYGAGYWGSLVSGTLTISMTSSGKITAKKYSVSTLGAGTSAGLTLISSENYSGGSSPFDVYIQSNGLGAGSTVLRAYNADSATSTFTYEFTSDNGTPTFYTAATPVAGIPAGNLARLDVPGLAYFAGNVGIGTNNPQAPLDVFNAAGGRIRVGNASGWGELVGDGGATRLYSGNSAWALTLGINNTEKMRIDTTGNVGIGTTTPGSLLTVDGNSLVTGNSVINGTVTSGLINGQTISSVANFTGTVNAATSITSPSFNIGSSLGGLIGTYPAVNSNGRSNIYSISSGYTGVANHYGLSYDQTGNYICVDGNGACNVRLGMDSGTITSGLINGQTISSAANFTGSVTLGGNLILGANTLTTSNTALVANLNADLFDGAHLSTVSESLRANNNITGGGTVSVDASYNLNWTSRFIVIANGNGSNFSTNGYFDITPPVATTAITGVGGAANSTWTASGINLPVWTALYYILPIGSGNGSVPANFRLVSYTGIADVPHDWVLLALRNGDNSNVRIANGITLLANQSWDSTINSSVAVPAGTLTGTTLASNVVTSSLTGVGALTSGSIASGFGIIATANTITGTTLNGTTGINTGAGAGTQRIDASGNLANIGTITSGLINGQTISSAANFTGTVAVAGVTTLNGLQNISGNNYTTYGPNSGWSASLRVGGNGYSAGNSPTMASVVTTNGNLHLDSGSDKTLYLNYYSGTGGINFGNGASGTNANVSAAGAYTGTSLNVGAGAITSGLINGQTISSAANFTGTVGVAGNLNIGSTALSGRRLELSSNGGSDGITFGQDIDNTETIQTFIDGQWANRGGYAGGCCNLLKINPDVGTVQIGSSTNQVISGLTVYGATTFGSTVGIGGALSLGSNTITSGLINGQTISSAANFTGTVNVAGTLTTKGPSVVPVIASSTAGSIEIPEVNTGSGGFATAIHQATIISAGYRQHLSLGTYRSGSAWNGGFFVGLGGNDNNPTEDYLMAYGGKISHSSGTISTDAFSATALTSSGTLNVTGQTTLGNASSTGLTVTNLYSTLANLGAITSTSLNISGQTTLATASSTGLTVTGGTYLATASGNVGIGTTTPAEKLEVNGNAQFDLGVSGYIKMLSQAGYNPGTVQSAYGNFLFSNNLVWNGMGWYAIGNGPGSQVQTEGTTGNIYLNTVASSSAGTSVVVNKRLTVLNNGNIGIGTTTPAGKLTVDLPNVSDEFIIGLASSTGQWAKFKNNGAGGSFRIETSANLVIMADAAGGGTYFEDSAGNVNATIAATSTANSYFAANGGNVGIGTTTPGTSLTVVGTTTLASTLVGTGGTQGASLRVPGLNADYLDGYDSSAFGDATLANQQQIMAKESSLIGLPVFGGDGSDGAGPASGSLTSAVKQYSSWTITGGITSSETGPTGIFVAVSGTLTLGTGGYISVTGKGQAQNTNCIGLSGSQNQNPVNFCVSGASGGAGSGAFVGANGSGAGGGGGVNGTSYTPGTSAGSTPQSKLTIARIMKTNIFSAINTQTPNGTWSGANDSGSNSVYVATNPIIGGAGGGSGSGAVGGSGGGVIYIEANTVTTSSTTPVIMADGAQGAGGSSVGNGGGGGGGIVWIRAKSLSGINTTTVTANGGAGGSGGGGTAGGSGAAGFVLIEKVN